MIQYPHNQSAVRKRPRRNLRHAACMLADSGAFLCQGKPFPQHSPQKTERGISYERCFGENENKKKYQELQAGYGPEGNPGKNR